MKIWHVVKQGGVLVLVLGLGLVAGYAIAAATGIAPGVENGHAGKQGPQKWYCSMHPQIVRDKPGVCPLCEMDLIPMPGAESAASSRWYCSMHPQIVRDEPGLCPICEMDLIPMPESITSILTKPSLSSDSSAVTAIRTKPVFVNLIEFPTRLTRTCFKRTGSD